MTRRQRIEDLATLALPSQPALSPDGTEVVYVLVTVDAEADKNVRSLARRWRPAQPGTGLAVTLLTNGGHTRDLYVDLYREIFAELAWVAMPAPLEPPAEPADADITPHAGGYERAGVLIEVLAGTDKTDGPVLRTTVTGPLAALTPDPVQEYPMTPVGPDLWLVREPGTETWTPVTFYALPTGERYLHFGVRATPKVS